MNLPVNAGATPRNSIWRSSSRTAAVEAFAYVALMIFAMATAGSGSGVVLILMPVVWLFLAFRLWLALWCAKGFTSPGGAEFLVTAGAIGLLSSFIWWRVLGGGASGWEGWSLFLISVMAHFFAAWFSDAKSRWDEADLKT